MNPYGGKKQFKARLSAISLSLLISILLMGLKFYAYRLTRSSAILSDALESIINVVASGFALVSILVAAKPPDDSHPYGHGKIEFFSAGFEGALIVIAAVGIFKTGYTRLLHPAELLHLQQGLMILLGASLINLFLGIGLIRVGNRTGSLILTADGQHVLTDVYTSGGVLVGLLLVKLTGWYWMDGAIACLVGLNILVTGGKLVGHSVAGLMDKSDPLLLDEISGLINKHRQKRWIDIHELRCWRSGSLIHLDLHLILPRDLSLEEAHREAKALEKVVKTHFKGSASVLIHMDPCLDCNCPICMRHLCQMRVEPIKDRIDWSRDTLTSKDEGQKALRQD